MGISTPMESILEQDDFDVRHLDSNTTAFKKDEKSVHDKDWSDWRNGLFAVGGHGFASFLGINPYESARMALARLRGAVPRKEPDGFNLAAITHGKLYEYYAAKLLQHLNPRWIDKKDLEDSKTEVWSLVFEKEGRTIDVAITPDIHSADSIWEIKCPYYGQGNFECPKQWADSWTAKNKPWGKTAYWAQAALYAVFYGIDDFFVAVNFVTDDEKMLIRTFQFVVTDETKELIISTLGEIACCDKASALIRKQKFKDNVDRIAQNAFISSEDSNEWYLHINGVLEEKSPDDTRNYTE